MNRVGRRNAVVDSWMRAGWIRCRKSYHWEMTLIVDRLNHCQCWKRGMLSRTKNSSH